VPVADTTAPTVALEVDPPLTPLAIGRGQSVPITSSASDAQGITRVDLLVDGELVDAKKGANALRFLIETAGMDAGTAHTVEARAFDPAGNVGTTVMSLHIAPDLQAPVATLAANATVGQGRVLSATVEATDDGRVARVELFLDGAITPIGTSLGEPIQLNMNTPRMIGG
jgi:hypothetical protein